MNSTQSKLSTDSKDSQACSKKYVWGLMGHYKGLYVCAVITQEAPAVLFAMGPSSGGPYLHICSIIIIHKSTRERTQARVEHSPAP